ncbi:MAG: DUF192 domain-containing protein [Candidatus Nanoarchaeia archaeon]
MRVSLVLLLVLVACSVAYEGKVTISGEEFLVEVADTHDEQLEGLMYRTSMPSNAGMIFVYDEVSPKAFWMKNTLIPLDMLFIDENFRIAKIHRNVQPCVTEYCEQYAVKEPVQYVLELNGGRAEAFSVNQTVVFEYI